MMDEVNGFVETSWDALETARVLYQAGRAAPAVYYACHTFEMAGNAFAAARGVDLQPDHSNLGRFKTQYHQAGLQQSLDPLMRRVQALRNASRYPKRVTPGSDQLILPHERISSAEADDLMRRVNGALYDVIFPNLWP